MNFEALLGKVFPALALSRARAALELEVVNRYRQLMPGRERPNLAATTSTESRELDWSDRLRVIAACRRLSRENPMVSGILNTFVANVVGNGIRPLPASGDPKFDAEAARLFGDWAENPELRGMVDLWDFQKIVLKTLLTDSDCGVLLTNAGLIQGIEGDAIQTPSRFASCEGFSISQGVQYSRSTGRPERYWLLNRQNSRNQVFDQNSARGVDARHFVHVFDVDRFSLYRGITPMFTALDWILDLDEICDFTKFAFKVQSIFAVALTGGEEQDGRPGLSGYGASSATGDAAKLPKIDLQKGTILDLSKYNAKDIKTIAPTMPGPHFEQFSGFLQNMIGLGFGLPVDLVTYQLHDGNYSSQRMVFRVSQKTFLQKWKIVTAAFSRIYAWKIAGFILSGKLRPGRNCQYPFYSRWSMPIPEVADPKNEIEASLWAEAAGYSDKESECLARGRDRREVMDKQAEVIAEMAERKIPFILAPTPGIMTLDELNAKIERLRKP